MKTAVKTITPKMAQEWLQNHNTKNRPISRGRVTQYAADMAAGSWGLSHQGIAFDEDGLLCDGQHRLAAIVEADVNLPMVVVTGLPKTVENGVVMDIRDCMDRGQRRSTGQQLAMSHGYTNANLTAACAKTIAGICIGNQGGSMSTAQTLKVLSIYGSNIEQMIGCPWTGLLRKAALQGTLAFAMSVDKPKVIDFANRLATMTDVPAKSPIQALNRWLANMGVAASKGSQQQFCRVVATCVVRHIEGSPIEKVIGSEEALNQLRTAQKSKVRQVCEIMGVVK